MKKHLPFEIADLIPHRDPMVLVDHVLELKDFEITTNYKIQENSLFLEKSNHPNLPIFSEMGLLENVAQTSYIFIRLYFEKINEGKERTNDPAVNNSELGFISSIQSLEIQSLPLVGDTIQTTTRTTLDYTSDFLKICSIDGTIMTNGVLLLSTTMKMLLKTEQT